ncbi:4a-hydroxytetrahydrobiopterin dehydratase [Candidatus Daviesbacteria bacterium]|nr:4a-hydroxytetrahydrobiopterin dehydratase [Candidatus Daviesbacteria bacterium]
MDSLDLASKHCKPCEGGTAPFKKEEYQPYLKSVPKWKDVEGKTIERNFKFENFKHALDFVNKVGAIAEEEGHHPDIYLHSFNKVKLTLTTHAISGLSENDFILASKIDKID